MFSEHLLIRTVPAVTLCYISPIAHRTPVGFPSTFTMILIDVNIEIIRALLNRCSHKNPLHFIEVAECALSLLRHVIKQDKILSQAFLNFDKLTKTRRHAAIVELQVDALQSKLDQLELTNKALTAAMLAVQSAVAVSAPGLPSSAA